MQKSKWWIYILLASFLILLVPKNILHDCSSEHTVKKSNRTEYSVAQEYCSICDFHFYPSVIQNKLVFFFIKIKILTQLFTDYQIVFVYTDFISQRGPPSDLF